LPGDLADEFAKPFLSAVDPVAKGHLVSAAGGLQETFQIEAPIIHAEARCLRVYGIEILFHVPFDGNHQQRLLEVSRLIHRFESRGASHASTSRHVAKKFLAVQLVKAQRLIGPFFGLCAWAVTEAVQWDLGMRPMPANDLVAIATIDQIDEEKVFLRFALEAEEIRSKQGRANEEILLGNVFGGIERQRGPAGSVPDHAHDTAHAHLLKPENIGPHVAWVLRHVLMSDAEHGHTHRARTQHPTCQRFKKTHDEIGLELPDHLPQLADALSILREPPQQTRERAQDRKRAVVLENKRRAGQCRGRDLKSRTEERRQTPVPVHADGDAADGMVQALQHLAQRDRLRHVSPALPLNRE